MEAFSTEQPITSSGTRMPQSPRRPTHQLPPRLNIHPAPTSELGPPAQVQVRMKSLGFFKTKSLIPLFKHVEFSIFHLKRQQEKAVISLQFIFYIL